MVENTELLPSNPWSAAELELLAPPAPTVTVKATPLVQSKVEVL
jgi:hypothetical protein